MSQVPVAGAPASLWTSHRLGRGLGKPVHFVGGFLSCKGHLTYGCARYILMCVQAQWLPSEVRGGVCLGRLGDAVWCAAPSFWGRPSITWASEDALSVCPSDTLCGLFASSLLSFCLWLTFPAPPCSFFPFPLPSSTHLSTSGIIQCLPVSL